MRTWEEAIKFDSGLTIGVHCVTLKHKKGPERAALVEITKRGRVLILPKPNSGDMYSCWMQIKGNALEHLKKSSVIVWGVHDPELMRKFDNPIMTISRSQGGKSA